MEDVWNRCAADVDEIYEEQVFTYCKGLRDSLEKEINNVFNNASRSVDGAKGDKIDSYKVEKPGLLSWSARVLGLGGTETKTRTLITVITAQVRDAILGLVDGVNRAISKVVDQATFEWKANLKKELLSVLRRSLGESEVHRDKAMILRAINEVVESVSSPVLASDNIIPEKLSSRGTLEGRQAEDYLEHVTDFLSTRDKKFRQDVTEHLKSMKVDLEINISDRFFASYNSRIEDLEKQLTDKETVMKAYCRLIQELNEVGD